MNVPFYIIKMGIANLPHPAISQKLILVKMVVLQEKFAAVIQLLPQQQPYLVPPLFVLIQKVNVKMQPRVGCVETYGWTHTVDLVTPNVAVSIGSMPLTQVVRSAAEELHPYKNSFLNLQNLNNMLMDFIVEIQISLKPGVIDAEGETVEKNLKLLGYGKVNKVKTLKVYHISIEGKSTEGVKKEMEDVCKKLLANPVIQNYEVKVKKE